MRLSDDQQWQLLRPRTGAAVILCAVVFTGWRVGAWWVSRVRFLDDVAGDPS